MTPDRFPETRHSVLAAAGSPDPEVRRAALGTLIESYWRPVYAYLRLARREAEEDARDLTQGFFASLLERDLVARFDPGRARFRTFLRVCLDGFAANADKAAGRAKRGGGAEHVPLDFVTAEGEIRRHEIPVHEDPDALFHREWIRALFATALDRLRAECAEGERELRFRLFERYDLHAAGPGERPTYAELAAGEGIDITKVTNELHAARRRLRTLVLERLREATVSEEEYRAEARELFGVDAA